MELTEETLAALEKAWESPLTGLVYLHFAPAGFSKSLWGLWLHDMMEPNDHLPFEASFVMARCVACQHEAVRMVTAGQVVVEGGPLPGPSFKLWMDFLPPRSPDGTE